jgi:hypothetical protein
MGVLTLKYGVSVSFCPQTGDVSKILGKNIGILSENLNFFKTHKNSYMRLLCITNPESVSFCFQTGDFSKSVG